MRQIVILLTSLAIAGTAACTSESGSLTAPVADVNSLAAKGGAPVVPGTATTAGAIVGSGTGVFDGGNFSASGQFTFDLRVQRDLVTGGTFGDTAKCGAGAQLTTTSNFSTLSYAGNTPLLEMTPGQKMVKSVRFGSWTAVSPVEKGQGPTSCSLHFRGDAVLDGVTEMSRMLTTCTATDGSTCSAWTLQACSTSLPECNDRSGSVPGDVPMGQLYGDFPRNIGNRPMARYEMPWSMTITKN